MSNARFQSELKSRRARRRLPIQGVLVAIDAPEVADRHFVVDALDINSLGLGLVLPPELSEGTVVELTFKLRDDTVFSRVGAVVRHQMGSSGGVSFEGWPAAARVKLLEYLIEHYESED